MVTTWIERHPPTSPFVLAATWPRCSQLISQRQQHLSSLSSYRKWGLQMEKEKPSNAYIVTSLQFWILKLYSKMEVNGYQSQAAYCLLWACFYYRQLSSMEMNRQSKRDWALKGVTEEDETHQNCHSRPTGRDPGLQASLEMDSSLRSYCN